MSTPEQPRQTKSSKLTNLTVDEMSRISLAFHRSATFTVPKQGGGTRVLSAEEIFVIVLAGQELGLGPSQAVMGIKMIKGKPEFSANLMAAMVRASGKYDFRTEFGTGETDADLWCSVTFFETGKGEALGSSRFSKADAEVANLWANNYLKFWRNMLFARALSNGVKWFVPDALMVTAYHEGETYGETDAPVPELPQPTAQQQVAASVSEAVTAVQEAFAPVEVSEADREPAVVAARPQDGYDGPETIDEQDVEVQEVGFDLQTPPEEDYFNPATEPEPPVVSPPSVEHTENERTINGNQLRLFHVKRKESGLDDDQVRAVLEAITGVRHADKIPARLFNDVLAHFNELKGAS